MKDEWKVYVRGNEDRGEEVIKALTDLGAKRSFCQTGTFSSLIYYIRHDGIIDSVNINGEFANIIKDNYKEIKLSELWKDGDVLICRYCEQYTVFSRFHTKYLFRGYMQLTKYNEQKCENEKYWKIEDYRLATPSEVEDFYELLHKHGVEWDVEKKQIVDLKWMPNKNEKYYLALSNGTVGSCTWLDDKIDNSRFSVGNCFKTEEEAEAIAEKFKKLLKSKL